MVIGFTGKEKEIKALHTSVCSLCNRMIKANEKCLEDKRVQGTWYYHTDCVVAYMTRMHVVEFKENVVVRSNKRKTQQKKARIREGEGTFICCFCRKTIEEDQTYVKKWKKNYHNQGRNSCIVRLNRVMNNSKIN